MQGIIIMNIIDIIIIVILCSSVIMGMHRGFINGVLSMAALILSLCISFSYSGNLNDKLHENKTIVNTLEYYMDATDRIGDIDLSMMYLSDVDQNILSEIIEKIDIPEVIQNIFIGEANAIRKNNVKISELLNRTIVDVTIAIISFLICFFISYVLLLIIVHMIIYVFELPVLRHFDTLIGGLFGFARGIMYIFILSTLTPIVLTIAPIQQIQDIYNNSQLISFFNSNILMMILNKIFS